MSKEREMRDLYDEIFIHGTSYKSLLEDGFTLDEINHVLVKGGLQPIAKRKESTT
jgi:hypothetical protein